MQKVFNLTNKYIVLATPLILYSLFSGIYLAASMGNGKIMNLLFAIILFTLMTGAFIAGWFNMIKIAISEESDKEPNAIIKDFPSGVGEYFLPALGSIFNMLLISILLLVLSFFVGTHYIGDPGVSAEALSKAMQNTTELKAFMTNLNTEQLIKLNNWNMLILGTLTLTYYLFFLYLPALFYKNKNPFIAYFISLKDLFSKYIFKTTGIFLLVFVINIFISVLSSLFGGNVVIHFLITLLNFYFITAVGVGVFYYYHTNFIKPAIGQNVDVKI